MGVAVRDRGEPVAEEDTQGIDDLAALGVVRGVGHQNLAGEGGIGDDVGRGGAYPDAHHGSVFAQGS
ncbi:hypothetical protein [Streptomyces swartbergensis]|uniref:hypothetical protein n=1 Tax=Streptomyces swartbergensis TaxID=487165 RepID=UPI003804A3DD